MDALVLTLTDAGMAALRAASGTNAIVIAQLGITDRVIEVSRTLTALPGEHRRLAAVSGTAVDDRTIHLTARDTSDATYTVRGLGLYLDTGTLFAVYAQPDPIFEKAGVATYLQAIDLRLEPGQAGDIAFGDANFLYPPATETTAGVAEVATQGEVDAGTDTQRIVTSRTLSVRLAALLATVNAAIDAVRDAFHARRIDTAGLALGGGTLATDRTISVPAATADQLRFATASNVALTPASFGDLGNVIGPAGSYTLPGGLTVKWGRYRARANSEATRYVAFDPAFPTACDCVLLTPYIAAANVQDDYFVQLAGEPSPQGFTAQYQSDDANGGLDGFDWLAIGR